MRNRFIKITGMLLLMVMSTVEQISGASAGGTSGPAISDAEHKALDLAMADLKNNVNDLTTKLTASRAGDAAPVSKDVAPVGLSQPVGSSKFGGKLAGLYSSVTNKASTTASSIANSVGDVTLGDIGSGISGGATSVAGGLLSGTQTAGSYAMTGVQAAGSGALEHPGIAAGVAAAGIAAIGIGKQYRDMSKYSTTVSDATHQEIDAQLTELKAQVNSLHAELNQRSKWLLWKDGLWSNKLSNFSKMPVSESRFKNTLQSIHGSYAQYVPYLPQSLGGMTPETGAEMSKRNFAIQMEGYSSNVDLQQLVDLNLLYCVTQAAVWNIAKSMAIEAAAAKTTAPSLVELNQRIYFAITSFVYDLNFQMQIPTLPTMIPAAAAAVIKRYDSVAYRNIAYIAFAEMLKYYENIYTHFGSVPTGSGSITIKDFIQKIDTLSPGTMANTFKYLVHYTTGKPSFEEFFGHRASAIAITSKEENELYQDIVSLYNVLNPTATQYPIPLRAPYTTPQIIASADANFKKILEQQIAKSFDLIENNNNVTVQNNTPTGGALSVSVSIGKKNRLQHNFYNIVLQELSRTVEDEYYFNNIKDSGLKDEVDQTPSSILARLAALKSKVNNEIFTLAHAITTFDNNMNTLNRQAEALTKQLDEHSENLAKIKAITSSVQKINYHSK